jgi:hypothetical protein
MNKGLSLICFFSLGLLFSCDLNEGQMGVFSYSFDFTTSEEGWTGDFADYPQNDSVAFGLQLKHEPLPENLSKTRKGITASGNNLNDDLFMFVKRKITGLSPNTSYKVLFNVKFASNAPTGSFEFGGAPGESVIMKAGASVSEPVKTLVSGIYRMNIDKGNRAVGGADMLTIGNIGVAATTTQYTEVFRNNNSSNPFQVTTNTNGEVWVIIGTDSGYSGTTTIYYTAVDILFNIVD